jgi:DNA primase
MSWTRANDLPELTNSLFREQKAHEWILNRRITEETAKTFQLGFCMPQHATLPRMFWGRVTFPIFDAFGNCIALAGRSLDGAPPKYYNTRYPKGKHLYGLHLAYKAIVQQDFAWVVEGYTDVIILHQHGIHNVVGMLSSHLTEEQSWLLHSFSSKMCILRDGSGGDTSLTFNTFFPGEFEDRRLPEGHDPDTYVLEYGPQALKAFRDPPKDELVDLRRKIWSARENQKVK